MQTASSLKLLTASRREHGEWKNQKTGDQTAMRKPRKLTPVVSALPEIAGGQRPQPQAGEPEREEICSLCKMMSPRPWNRLCQNS